MTRWHVKKILFILGVIVLFSLPFQLEAQQLRDKASNMSFMDDGSGKIKELVARLEKREKELQEREKELEDKETRLRMLERSITNSLKEYTTLRDKLQKEKALKKKKGGMEYIARIYEAMPPEEAAQRIEKMNETMAVKLLIHIKRKQAGKIIAAMKAEKAAILTEKMARMKGEK